MYPANNYLKTKMMTKRREFAETYDYYILKRKWGDHEEYGYELKAPYSEDEVAPIKDVIPADLYWYLTNISRETNVSYYPTTFEIRPCSSKPGVLTKDLTYIHNDEVDISGLMLKISTKGCAFFDAIYIGKDEQYGSVWSYLDDDAWIKSASTFIEYICR